MNSKKQYIIIFIFISLFVRVAVSQDTNKDKFYQGVTYFTAGSYKEALQIWTDMYNFVSLFLSTNTWAKISITSFIIFLLLLSLYFYSSRYRHKVIGFWLGVFFIVLSLTSLAFTIRNKSLVYDSHKAIISSPIVNGKSSPDKSGNDIFVLHEGTKVTVEDEVGEWSEIRLSDGNKGWVPLNSIIII